jgi:hypothetical protein
MAAICNGILEQDRPVAENARTTDFMAAAGWREDRRRIANQSSLSQLPPVPLAHGGYNCIS